MAVHVLTAARLLVSGVDFSDHISSITVESSAAEVDSTNFASAGWEENLGGLKKWSATIQWQQDFAASEVDATLTTLVGSTVSFNGRYSSATGTSATNPAYYGNLLVTSLPRVSGAVGDLHGFSVTWPGTGALTYATS